MAHDIQPVRDPNRGVSRVLQVMNDQFRDVGIVFDDEDASHQKENS
jgi:hypothetical protein